MWFTENPWPPMFFLGLAACGMFVAWFSQKRAIWLAGSLAALVGCGAIYRIEQTIVTESEKVEALLRTLVADFQKRDREAVLSAISKNEQKWRDIAVRALDDVEVQNDLDIKDLSVALSNHDSQATTRFRANGTFTYKQSLSAYHPSRWELHWRKEGGLWKVVDVVRLDPLKEEKKEIFAP